MNVRNSIYTIISANSARVERSAASIEGTRCVEWLVSAHQQNAYEAVAHSDRKGGDGIFEVKNPPAFQAC